MPKSKPKQQPSYEKKTKFAKSSANDDIAAAVNKTVAEDDTSVVSKTSQLTDVEATRNVSNTITSSITNTNDDVKIIFRKDDKLMKSTLANLSLFIPSENYPKGHLIGPLVNHHNVDLGELYRVKDKYCLSDLILGDAKDIEPENINGVLRPLVLVCFDNNWEFSSRVLVKNLATNDKGTSWYAIFV